MLGFAMTSGRHIQHSNPHCRGRFGTLCLAAFLEAVGHHPIKDAGWRQELAIEVSGIDFSINLCLEYRTCYCHARSILSELQGIMEDP